MCSLTPVLWRFSKYPGTYSDRAHTIYWKIVGYGFGALHKLVYGSSLNKMILIILNCSFLGDFFIISFTLFVLAFLFSLFQCWVLCKIYSEVPELDILDRREEEGRDGEMSDWLRSWDGAPIKLSSVVMESNLAWRWIVSVWDTTWFRPVLEFFRTDLEIYQV